MPIRQFATAALLSSLLAASLPAGEISFRRDIAPILLERCVGCHGPKKAEGNYRVDSFQRMMQPGDSGLAAFTAGDLGESEVFRRIISDDADERMPLDADPFPTGQIAIFERWIEQGADFDGPQPDAALATIVPPPTHPDPPAIYPASMPITALAFSSDGSRLAAAGYHEVIVWDPADGSLQRRIRNVAERTYGLDFSPRGGLLAVAGGQPGRLGEVRLFDPASGELKAVVGTAADVVLDTAFSPDGSRIAIAAADHSLRVFEVQTGAEQLAITSHADWVTSVAWNGDGRRLASGSRDKTAKVFDAATGELIVTYSGHNDSVNGVAFHPNGNEMWSSSADRRLHQWKIGDGKKSHDLMTLGAAAFEIEAGADFLFVASADKTARQIDAKSRKQLRSYSGHNDAVLSVDYHAGTSRLATGSFDGEVRIWDTSDGRPLVDFLAAPGLVAD